MDCSSCHNVHVNEVNSPAIFSKRCISCHNCSIKPTPGLVLSDNCVDCHMPRLASKKITLKLANIDQATPDLVRSHKVAVYPEQTKEFIKRLSVRP